MNVFWMCIVMSVCAGLVVAGEVEDLTQEAFLKRVAAGEVLVILDVRSEAEFKAGRVPGAVNIPHDQLADRLKELANAKEKDVVLYCRSGYRAGVAAKVLQKNGFTQLFHLEGDMKGWEKAKRDLEK